MVAGHVNGPVIPTVGVHCTSRHIQGISSRVPSRQGRQFLALVKVGFPSGSGVVSEVVCLSSDLLTIDRLFYSASGGETVELRKSESVLLLRVTGSFLRVLISSGVERYSTRWMSGGDHDLHELDF